MGLLCSFVRIESDLRVSGGLALDTTDFGISTAIENLAEM